MSWASKAGGINTWPAEERGAPNSHGLPGSWASVTSSSSQATDRSTPLSAADKAARLADDKENNIWGDADVDEVFEWVLEQPTRRPNKKVGSGGGRLAKLNSIITNGCPYVHQVLERHEVVQERRAKQKRKQDEFAFHLRFVAPLAKQVLVRLEAKEKEEEDNRYHSDDDDFDEY